MYVSLSATDWLTDSLSLSLSLCVSVSLCAHVPYFCFPFSFLFSLFSLFLVSRILSLLSNTHTHTHTHTHTRADTENKIVISWFWIRYEILRCGHMDKLIKKRKSPAETPIYYVTIEDTFDVIRTAHLATGHGGRNRVLKELEQKFANVHRESVELFKCFCKVCQEKTSLREAVILGSQSGGQGYVKCNCSGAKKCQNNRCKCFKEKLKCNSRCHQSLTFVETNELLTESSVLMYILVVRIKH